MSDQITTKLRAAGFSQAELDAPNDNDRLLVGLVASGLDPQSCEHHYANRRRFELAYQRCKLLGLIAWCPKAGRYVVASTQPNAASPNDNTT